MTYSLEHLAFRVAAGVVNTAARAANNLLEVMYPPRYDTAHIWDDSVPVGNGRLCEGCVRDTCPDVCPYMPDAQNFAGAAASLADDNNSPGVLLRSSVREDKQQAPGFGAPAGPQPNVPAGSVASGGPAPTDPPSGGVADPAAEKVNPPDLSAAGSLTWSGWAQPAIWEVLCAHTPYPYPDFTVHCVDATTDVPLDCHKVCADWEEWREHVSSFIADRIACDPTRAVLALTSLQKQ